jgi:hypothetical protein
MKIVMRSLIVMLSLASILSFFGCKTDDDKPDPSKRVIEEKYRGTFKDGSLLNPDYLIFTENEMINYTSEDNYTNNRNPWTFPAWTEGNVLHCIEIYGSNREGEAGHFIDVNHFNIGSSNNIDNRTYKRIK